MSGQSVSIANKLTDAIKSATQQERVLQKQPKDSSATYRVENEVDGNSTRIDFYLDVDDESFEVDFFVNDSVDSTAEGNDEISESTKRKITRTILMDMKKAFKEFPDGSKFKATAYDGDKRASVYQKFGFSEPSGAIGYQYAVKRDGKITPATEDDLLELFDESTTDTEIEQLLYEIFFTE